MRQRVRLFFGIGIIALGLAGLAPGWAQAPHTTTTVTVTISGAPASAVVGDTLNLTATIDPPGTPGFLQWTLGRESRAAVPVIPDCTIFSDPFGTTTTLQLGCEPPVMQTRDPNTAVFEVEAQFFPDGSFTPVIDTEMVMLDLSSPSIPYIRSIVPNPPPAPGITSFFDVFTELPPGWQITREDVTPPSVDFNNTFQWQFIQPTATVDLLGPQSQVVQLQRTMDLTLVRADLWQGVLDNWMTLLDQWAALYLTFPIGSPERDFATNWTSAKGCLCDGYPKIDDTIEDHGLTQGVNAVGDPVDDILPNSDFDPDALKTVNCVRVRINPGAVCNNEPFEWPTPGPVTQAVPRKVMHVSLKLILVHEMRHVAEMCANRQAAIDGDPLPIPTLNDSEAIAYAFHQLWGKPWPERFDQPLPDRIKDPGIRFFGPTVTADAPGLLTVNGEDIPETTVPGVTDELLLQKFKTLVNANGNLQTAGISAAMWPTNILRFPGLPSVTDLSFTTADDFLIINRSPEVVFGTPPTGLQFGADGTATVNLDASGSFDPDGTIVQREWFVNGTPQPPLIDTELLQLQLTGTNFLGQTSVRIGHVLTDDGFGFPVGPVLHAITPEDAESMGSLARAATVDIPITDAIAPQVDVVEPNPTGTRQCCVGLRADASDNVAVQGVEFFVDGASVGQGVEDTPGVWLASWPSFNACTMEGPHAIAATATDFWGNQTPSAVLNFTIDNEIFSDVLCSSAAFNFITTVVCNGIAAGFPDGTYKPANTLNRGQMAVFMARSADAILHDFAAFTPPPPGSESFSDVPSTHGQYKFIEYIVAKGIASGFPDGTYKPANSVNRNAMSVFLSRVRTLIDHDFAGFTPPACGSEHFSDVPCTHPSYKFIEYIVSKGIAAGFPDGTYHPNNAVRRDQMAIFVSRCIGAVLACPLP